jgi:hypothetical protein
MSSDRISSDDSSVVSATPAVTTSVLKVINDKKKAAVQPQLSTDVPAKSVAARHHWPSMAGHVVNDSHGSQYKSYPFLKDSNEQDKALVHNLLVYQPFLQKRGEQTPAWNNVVEMCNFATLDDKTPVFHPSLNEKSTKQRFSDYMSFMEKYRETNKSGNSGGDNEPFPEILQGLEDLYDLHKSWKDQIGKKRTSTAYAQARDRTEDEAIHDASLGIYVAAAAAAAGKENHADADGGKKCGRHQNVGGRNNAGREQFDSFHWDFDKYEKDKQESKRRHMDYREKRLALEKQRIEEDRTARETMMDFIKKLSEK